MDVREEFSALLDEFAGASKVMIDRPDAVSAVVGIGDEGDLLVNLELLPESAAVVAWAAVGRLGDDANRVERAAYLLSSNDRSYVESGFILSLDDRIDEVVAHDVRPLAWFEGADRLAAWIEALVELVRDTIVKCEEFYPYADDEPLEDIIEEVK